MAADLAVPVGYTTVVHLLVSSSSATTIASLALQVVVLQFTVLVVSILEVAAALAVAGVLLVLLAAY